MLLVAFHLIIGAALFGLAVQSALNWKSFARLQRAPAARGGPFISVLIPARNEGARIAGCVQSWRAQQYPNYEILVYDDDSSDDTSQRAAAAAAGASHIRIICGAGLPEGWRGKAYACHCLRAAAQGEVLVFADADITPAPDTLASTAQALKALGVTVLSAVPVHTSASLALRALLPIQNWAAFTFVPWWLSSALRRPMFAAMNGQFIAIHAATYDESGGFAAVRGSVGEDADLGRLLVRSGYRTPLLDGSVVLRCAPYVSLREYWNGNTRNLLTAFFGSAVLLLAAMLVLTALYFGPIVILSVGYAAAAGGTALWIWLPLGELVIGTGARAIVDSRFGYSAWPALLHPFAVVCLLGIALDAIVRFRVAKRIAWRGRHYASPVS